MCSCLHLFIFDNMFFVHHQKSFQIEDYLAPCGIATDDGIGVVLTHGRPTGYTADQLHLTLSLLPKPNFMQAAVNRFIGTNMK